MAHPITLVIIAIMALVSLSSATTSTAAAVQRVEAIPTQAMAAEPTSTVICNDACFGVDRADIVDAVNHYCDDFGEWTYPIDGEAARLSW